MIWATCTITDEMRRRHSEAGGRDLMRLVADLPDGFELRMMAGREPLVDGGKAYLHVSVSVGFPGALGAYRRPTDEEMDAVRDCWDEVLIEETGDPRSHIRQLWEATSK